jgi:HEAT repeat protein
MAKFLQNLGSSQFSFWIGFAAGCLFWWFQIRFRKAIPGIRTRIGEIVQTMRHGLTANTEARLKSDMLRYVQGLHLAAPLFSLDEILVRPRLLTLPFNFQMENKTETEEGDEARLGIPYLPDWPGLAAAFHEPMLSLPETLNGGANLILMGAPGSGKTTALAYLATIVIRQSEEAGDLREFLPLLIHVSDLAITLGLPEDPIDTLVAAVSVHVSPLTLPRLKTVIRTELEQGRLLLLIDGLDEQPTDAVEPVVDFLAFLTKKYPSMRAVAAASLEYFDGLSALGFVPAALAAWDDQQKNRFVQAWGELWKHYIERPPQAGQEIIDNLLINNWLAGLLTNCSPFEVTLKVWAAYAGDAPGPTNLNAIEGYLVRMVSNIPKARQVLEKLALQMVVDRIAVVEAKAADHWMPELAQQVIDEQVEEPDLVEVPALSEEAGPDENIETPEIPIEEVDQEKSSKETEKATARVALSLQRVLSDLVSCGLLFSRKDQRVTFVHPIILGYLAGAAVGSSGDFHCLDGQANWTGGRLALHYYLACNDQSQLVAPMLNTKDDPLFRQILTAGSFLSDALPSAPWRHQLMHRLAIILQNEMLSTSLRTRALCALVSSGDPGLATLFRQLITNRLDSVRQMAVFGWGMLHDVKAVQDLIALLDDPAPNVRQAVIPALAAIGTKPAMDAILQTLGKGSEELRRSAAEVLAGFPEEGHPALREGSTNEDLLVRRAVVYGLVRVNQPWATEMLQKMQIEDGQWVVRSAATQAIEELQALNTHIPRPLPTLHESPWLISYAGKQGMGVSKGKSAQNILRQVLINGDREEQMAALNYLAVIPDPGVVPQLYEILYGSTGELREAVYNTLWFLAAGGVELPSPTQFGLG